MIKKLTKYFICIIGFFLVSGLILKIFFETPGEFTLNNATLYKDFLLNFLSFNEFKDRYGYGFHYLQTILLLPFLIFKYSIGEFIFGVNGFVFIGDDPNLNHVILYSGKIVSLLSFFLLNFFVYKIILRFTKERFFALMGMMFVSFNFEILNYTSLFRVDIPLTAFCIGSLYFAIRYLEKYKLKYLLLFLLFSIFAFIIKYQALIYLSGIYLLLFIYTIVNKKYKTLGYGGLAFIMIFGILNFNYSQLVYNLQQRFDLDSKFMGLTRYELSNKEYDFLGWLNRIKSEILFNMGYENYIILLVGILSFILLFYFNKFKKKFLLLLLVPLIINYYVHTSIVYILAERHFLLLYAGLSIIAVLGIFFFYSIFLFNNKYIKNKQYFKNILLACFLLVIVSNFIGEINYKDNYYTKIRKLEKIESLINKDEELLFLIDRSLVPFALNRKYKSIVNTTDFKPDKLKIDNLIRNSKQIIVKEELEQMYKSIYLLDFEIVGEFYCRKYKYFIYKRKDVKEIY